MAKPTGLYFPHSPGSDFMSIEQVERTDDTLHSPCRALVSCSWGSQSEGEGIDFGFKKSYRDATSHITRSLTLTSSVTFPLTNVTSG